MAWWQEAQGTWKRERLWRRTASGGLAQDQPLQRLHGKGEVPSPGSLRRHGEENHHIHHQHAPQPIAPPPRPRADAYFRGCTAVHPKPTLQSNESAEGFLAYQALVLTNRLSKHSKAPGEDPHLRLNQRGHDSFDVQISRLHGGTQKHLTAEGWKGHRLSSESANRQNVDSWDCFSEEGWPIHNGLRKNISRERLVARWSRDGLRSRRNNGQIRSPIGRIYAIDYWKWVD